jgi:PilZ domain
MSTDPVQLERRSGQRFQLHLPISIHFDGKTVPGFTQDVSARGLFLFTDELLAEGTVVEITFTMPSEITLAESMRVRCQGRVLRANPSPAGPRTGIAVQFDSYQYLPSLECEPMRELGRVSVADRSGKSPGATPR